MRRMLPRIWVMLFSFSSVCRAQLPCVGHRDVAPRRRDSVRASCRARRAAPVAADRCAIEPAARPRRAPPLEAPAGVARHPAARSEVRQRARRPSPGGCAGSRASCDDSDPPVRATHRPPRANVPKWLDTRQVTYSRQRQPPARLESLVSGQRDDRKFVSAGSKLAVVAGHVRTRLPGLASAISYGFGSVWVTTIGQSRPLLISSTRARSRSERAYVSRRG